METVEAADGREHASSARKNGQTSLLDSGEDFEVVDEPEDFDEEPPPLEDAGGGVEKSSDETAERSPHEEPEAPAQLDEWLDVLGNGQLKKKVTASGKGRASRPQKGQNVRIHLKTSLMDGTLVEEQPNFSFTLGDCDVIQALDLTVQLMEMGEKALIQSDAKYAYGDRGSLEPRVPPNAQLSLEVELLEATDSPDVELLPPAEKIALASRKRERGNVHYQRGDYAFAVNSYSIALQIAESSSKVDIRPEEEDELLDVRVKCLNNMAASQLKLDHYDAALKSCVSALEHQPDNIKALFRMGKVLSLKGEYTEAIQTLRKALKLDPSNKVLELFSLGRLSLLHLASRWCHSLDYRLQQATWSAESTYVEICFHVAAENRFTLGWANAKLVFASALVKCGSAAIHGHSRFQSVGFLDQLRPRTPRCSPTPICQTGAANTRDV